MDPDCDAHEAVAQILLSAGADVNANNNNGETPLHCATHKNNSSIVQILLSAGADINAKDMQGRLHLIAPIVTSNVELMEAKQLPC